MKLTSLLLLSLALLAATGPAAARDQDADAHQQAVSAMIDASKLSDAVLVWIKEGGEAPGPNRELLQHMDAHATRAELIALYVPIYAPLLSTESARQVAQAFATADGRKVAEAMVARSMKHRSPVAKPSPAEQKVHARFGSTPAFKQFAALHERTKHERDKVIGDWMAAYHSALQKNAYEAMNAHFLAFDAKGDHPPAPFVPAHIGVPDIDAWIIRLSKISSRNVAAEWQFQKDMEKMDLKKLLSPHSLSSPQIFIDNDAIMDVLTAYSEAYLLELDLALQEYAASVGAIAPAGSERALHAQKDVDEQLQYGARFARNNRALLGTIGRILQFARDRKGRLSVKDGVLMLGKEDHAIYSAYAAQFEREMEESEKLVASRSRRKSNLF